MIAWRYPAIVTLALLAASCGKPQFRPPVGGDKERALIAATKAVDVQKVKEALAGGADPNMRVDIDGYDQSAWFLALQQLREKRPETVDIVRAMLGSGASLKTAFGAGSPRPKDESFWTSFTRGGRVSGSYDTAPIAVAMDHPVPDVIRLLTQKGWNPADGQQALLSAIESGEIEIAHILVDAGVNVNCQPSITPLVAAIERRDQALIAYLEEHGAREKP